MKIFSTNFSTADKILSSLIILAIIVATGLFALYSFRQSPKEGMIMDQNSVPSYSGTQFIIDTTTTPGTTYFCFTNSGNRKSSPYWQILRLKDGVGTYANFSDKFHFIANEVATYSYDIPASKEVTK